MHNSKAKEIHQLEIPVQLDENEIIKRAGGGRATPRQLEMMKELLETAPKIARPLGIYKLSRARVIDGSKVDIDGVVFTSKVLSKLLAGRDKAVPFIVTEGKELDAFPIAKGDMMKQFYLDTIKTMIVAGGVKYLKEHVQKEFGMPQAALMNPGEIEDWYLTEQKPLFSLFDDVEGRIGVTLSGGGVMKPIKSRSGIIFPNESGFETCQLCIQFKCPGRRCKFEPELYRFYLDKNSKALVK